ncbi:hypothetical protein ALTERO38_51629 [Alteromonas sp. 38]|nr:hypothetical protein ALTER154_80176 [Alteromonas sp. 154]VXB81011.1 hypothetical protein ALTERO38_51629 [Alteromonas sp. 38]
MSIKQKTTAFIKALVKTKAKCVPESFRKQKIENMKRGLTTLR